VKEAVSKAILVRFLFFVPASLLAACRSMTVQKKTRRFKIKNSPKKPSWFDPSCKKTKKV
jgi:hypothetical protein